jgi:hypothetical protein
LFGRNLPLLDEFDSFKICFVAWSGMIKRNFNIKSDLTLPFWDFFSIFRQFDKDSLKWLVGIQNSPSSM